MTVIVKNLYLYCIIVSLHQISVCTEKNLGFIHNPGSMGIKESGSGEGEGGDGVPLLVLLPLRCVSINLWAEILKVHLRKGRCLFV